MPDLVYQIKTVADVRALQATKKGLEDNIKVTKELGQSTAVLERELQKANAALETQRGKAGAAALELNKTIAAVRKAGGNASALVGERNSILMAAGIQTPGRFSEAFSAFRGAGGGIAGIGAAGAAAGFMSPAAAGVIAGVAGVAAIGAKALHEYGDAEERIAKLDMALAQRAQLTDAYRESLQDLANTLEQRTGESAGSWISVLTRLTQFGADSSNIKGSVEAVEDLAGVLGGDLQTAALMVGKAIQGEFTGFTKLGLELDKNASQAEKLAKAYQFVKTMGGGQLAASNDTLFGSFKMVGIGIANVLQLGGKLIDQQLHLKEVNGFIGKQLSQAAEFWGGYLKRTEGVKNVTEDVAKKLLEESESFQKVQTSINGANIELERYLENLKQESTFRQSESDANAELQKAKVSADLKAGRISQQQADIQIARIDQTAANQSAGIRQDARRDQDARFAKEFQEGQKRLQEARGPEAKKAATENLEALFRRAGTTMQGYAVEDTNVQRGNVQRSQQFSEAFTGEGLPSPTVGTRAFGPTNDFNGAIAVLNQQVAYWRATAEGLAGVVNITAAQKAQLDQAIANVNQLKARVAIMERQNQNRP